MKNQTAKTVAQTLIDRVFTKIGCPLIVTSDQGRQFMSETFQELADLMGFKHFPTTAYHQSANGQAERAVGIIKRMLAPYLIKDQKDWDSKLQLVVFAYNNSTNATTKETPFFIAHVYDPITPSDLALRINIDTIDLTTSWFKQELAGKIKAIWEKVAENIENAQEKQKEHFDKRHGVTERELKVCDLVLIREMTEFSPKFAPKWNGPYRVIAVSQANVVILRNGKPYEVHKNRTKQYYGPGILPLREIWGEKSVRKLGDKNLEESEDEE
jgi:hypothetical protein